MVTLISSGGLKLVKYLTEKPQALAVLVAVVAIGVVTGVVPLAFSDDIQTIKDNQDSLKQEHKEMAKQIQDAVDAAVTKGRDDTQLLRGICILSARGNEDLALKYCNP